MKNIRINGTVTNNGPDYINPALLITAKAEGVDGYAINNIIAVISITGSFYLTAEVSHHRYSQDRQVNPNASIATKYILREFRASQLLSSTAKPILLNLQNISESPTLDPLTIRNNYTIYDVNIYNGLNLSKLALLCLMSCCYPPEVWFGVFCRRNSIRSPDFI